MFFFLSKILLFLTYPLTWILVLLIFAYVYRYKSISRKLVLTAISIFFIFSNSFIYNQTMKHWEGENEFQLKPSFPVVVILGGYSGWNKSHQSVEFYESSDRLIKGIEVYKKGIANKILISGGSGLVLQQDEKEGLWTKQVLINLGIDEKDILIESESRNTYENAVNTKLILDSLHIDESILLITSASHMNRAQACFKKAGVKIWPHRVDFQVDESDYTLETYLLPSAITLASWQIILKEWIGYLYYALRGFI